VPEVSRLDSTAVEVERVWVVDSQPPARRTRAVAQDGTISVLGFMVSPWLDP
jgi:hypothetical protein